MRQDRLTSHTIDALDTIKGTDEVSEREHISTRVIKLNLSDFKTNPLWPILVETTRRSPLYPGLVGYVRDHIIPKSPEIDARQLACKLSISLGEALVILDDIK